MTIRTKRGKWTKRQTQKSGVKKRQKYRTYKVDRTTEGRQWKDKGVSVARSSVVCPQTSFPTRYWARDLEKAVGLFVRLRHGISRFRNTRVVHIQSCVSLEGASQPLSFHHVSVTIIIAETVLLARWPPKYAWALIYCHLLEVLLILTPPALCASTARHRTEYQNAQSCKRRWK